jgi:lysophospholipase L1-like esterase
MRKSLTAAVAVLAVGVAGTAITLDVTDNESRVAFVGDSITRGYGSTERYADILNDEEGLSTRVWAVDGATSLRWISQYPHLLNDISGYDPDKIVVMLGTNSYIIGRSPVDEAAHLRQLLNIIRDKASTVQIYVVRTYDACMYGFDCNTYRASSACDMANSCNNEPKPAASWDDYGKAMRSIADETDSEYVDLGDWLPSRSMVYTDRVHLNDTGHAILAGLLKDRL